jgi:hypothetical protein
MPLSEAQKKMLSDISDPEPQERRGLSEAQIAMLEGRDPEPLNEDIPTDLDVMSVYESREAERERLEQEFAQAEAERAAAQRRLEGADDTVLENLVEGVQEMSAGGVSGVVGALDFVTSPIRAGAEIVTGRPVQNIRQRLAGTALDPEQTFMEEREIAKPVRAIGEIVPLGAGFVPVTRDPGKFSSALQDILGLGMTESAVVAKASEAVERGFNLQSEAGLSRFADDAATRYDVEQNRGAFDDYEDFTNRAMPEYERKLDALSEELDEARLVLQEAEQSASYGREARIEAAQKDVDDLIVAIGETPVAPSISGNAADRVAFVRQELRSAGVADDVIDGMNLANRYAEPKLFNELIEYDVQSMRSLYQNDPSFIRKLDSGAGSWFNKAGAPASKLVSKIAGPRIGRIFESAFESGARRSELLFTRYFSDERSAKGLGKKNNNDLEELAEWADGYDIKAMFLDLRTAANAEEANARLKGIADMAKGSVSDGAYRLFKTLIADSRRHQSEASRIYRPEVRRDEFFWASSMKMDRSSSDLAPESVSGKVYTPGTQERTRGLAADMTPDELDRYANPILTQINRIAEEQVLIELAKAFKVRPSMGIGDDSSAFMSSLADAVARQSKSREVGDAVSNLTATTFKGAKSAPGSTIQNLMKLSYAGTLGQFDSAFLNLHDAAVAMVKNGVVPTLKAILNREGMDITEFGIGGNPKNIQEFQAGFDDSLKNDGTLDKVSDWYQDVSFKVSLFRAADRAGKGIVIRSSLNKFRDLATRGDKYFDELEHYATPAELTKIRKSLVQNKTIEEMPEDVSEIVLRMAFSRLGEQQLISAAGRPIYYLKNPTLRPLWMMTGFAIKQAEIMRLGIVQNLKEGNYKEAGKFTARYMGFAGLGYGIINQMRGVPQAVLGDEDKAPSMEGLVRDTLSQPVQVATFGRLGTPYGNRKFQEDPVGYLSESALPPTGLIGNVAKDFADILSIVRGKDVDFKFETLRSIPGGEELRAALLSDS